MTREDRILSLSATVDQFARRESRYCSFDDVVGWAWITAIQVVDKYPDLSDNELRAVVAVAIHRREIDRRRQMSVGDHGRERWMREVPLDPVFGFRCEYSERQKAKTEARIVVEKLSSLLKPIEHGPHRTRSIARDRAWKILWATVAEEKSDAEIAPLFGISDTRVAKITRDTIAKLRAAI